MRPAGRVAAAIEVLDDIEARRRPVADALRDWGLSHRFAGSGDRAAIGNLVYDVLRWRASSAYRAGEETSHATTLATLRFRWGMALSDVEAMAGDRHGPAAPSADLVAALSEDRLAEAPADIAADVPAWVAASLEENFAEEWQDEAKALAARAPVDIRVNTLKSSREKAAKALSPLIPAETPISPVGLRLGAREGWARAPAITREAAYQRGHVEVQDEASQAAALLVFAQPGEKVLDLCAGAGGKTLAMAAAMDNRGQIHATDRDAGQLAPIHERLKRAGVRNVTVHRAGSDLSALEGRMDRVLVDAPCSGSGTWRRRPDTKWRLTKDALVRRREEQAAALDDARGYVRRGGYLVYVTCSVLPEENEAQVDEFLARAPEFAPVSAGEAWEELFGVGGPKPWSADGMSLTMTPFSTGTDGFFLAVLERMTD
ncbi:MAG: RsmB/NOP family class I SAM-dependent RNA methyltransferase [Pseudomonadota bacterium]